VARLAAFTLNANAEVSQAARGAVRDYMLIDPGAHLTHILALTCDHMDLFFSTSTHYILRSFESMMILLHSFIEAISMGFDVSTVGTLLSFLLSVALSYVSLAFGIDPSHLAAVRAKIEGTCMLWLCHNNANYRNKALHLAQLLAHPALRYAFRSARWFFIVHRVQPTMRACRKLERDLKAPFLIDAICKYEQDDPFLPNIKDFLIHYRESYFTSIKMAWLHMFPLASKRLLSWVTDLSSVPKEQLMLWKRYFRFLCAVPQLTDDGSLATLSLSLSLARSRSYIRRR